MLRVNSHAGLSYVAWKCTSTGPLSTAPNAAQQPIKLHSQWIPQRHVAVVHPASPDANAALGRGPHDSKFEVDNPRVELWSSKGGSVGRFTVAKQCIRPGERAFQASAFAVVVRQSLAPRRCHWCFAALRKKALQCGDCEFARYCSRECLAADAALHDFQCPALRELKRRGERAGVGDVETVRLALAVLSMEEFVRNPRALELLAVHRRRDADEEKEVRSAVAVIVEMTGRVVDPKHVQLTLERVRCDAHPLYLDGVTFSIREQERLLSTLLLKFHEGVP
ncbi:putative histone tail methylase containing SET domain [Phytophthora cinnamomi]|uniref:putative histone tail methylase containing SET domain n=1 Tax=Phytophthora cinnamomi TaxID=4785 RepID=UPI00355A5C31|nr:putative histone tail methylase containing SET domain [Phytophthora cinnamomi]